MVRLESLNALRSGVSAVVLMITVPFLVLLWVLTGAVVRHDAQQHEAEQVFQLFRSGMTALQSLEEMRTLSRPAGMVNPPPHILAPYEAALANSRQQVGVFIAQVRTYADGAPSLMQPAQRLEEQLDTLGDAAAGIENSTLGPYNIIRAYIDEVYALLATVLYSADLPAGEGGQVDEMLLLIPDSLRRMHAEIGLLCTLSIPSEVNLLASNDLGLFDQSFENIAVLLDMAGNQLRSIEQVGGALPAGQGADRLEDVRAFVDQVENDFILSTTGQDLDTALTGGRDAHAAVDSVAQGLLTSVEANTLRAVADQRMRDVLMLVGLLCLYAALVYFAVHFYRARDAALRERELAREIVQRKQRENELMLLNELSERLMACNTRMDAYDVFGRSAAALFAGRCGAFAAYAPETQKCRTVAEWGGVTFLAPSFPVESCTALVARQPSIVADPLRDSGCQHFHDRPGHAHTCLPLVMQEQTLGLLWLENGSDEPGDGASLQLAMSAGEALKLALSNIQLREALHEQATRDALTGLYNRRYLHDVFGRELARASRMGQSLALALIDIDHFKQVNDTHGHEAGDQALVGLSEYMGNNLRASDLTFRLGGEEFVLLLHTDLAGAVKCVDNLRTGFQAIAFPFGGGKHLTFSAGIVEAPHHGDTLEQLLQSADEALYRAKGEGRNRVLTALRTA